ncbi:methyl-accepting chemotaxis protein [Undibacterium sp. CY21W]|uniref:methyl-accepting chemotaxis protein n=1 Tax=Undibacterium sp. CY21W TaxID=2762293 RepID=UPI00164C2FDF|nr:methyl-accepting chemotaxis protein [Undibacterium sp. CY21W]MBC3929118.1 cache domain-containing protein [Undibacterium sp. CY21W]
MKLSFRSKLYLPLIISWLCLLGISTVNILQNKAQRFEERQIALRFATDVGMSTVKEYAALVSSGAMPLEEAQKQALARLKAMRYGKDGYYTVINSHPTVVMHPIKAELVGKDVSDFKDPNGQFLYRNIATIAKESGEGWIEYVWTKPGNADPKQVFPKGAYLLTYKPWDWTFITGLYLDDLTDAFIKDLWSAIFLLAGIGIVLSAIIVIVARNIERAIGGEPEYAADIAKGIAAGDLTIDVHTRENDQDSLLFAMKSMRQSLAKVVGEVRQSTDMIATASSEIASGNLDLSARTEEQAGSLEETAASMEELTSTVKQNAENARQANQLVLSTADVAAKGSVAGTTVVNTMEAINSSSKKIVDIISVIDGIAFQTNILALNAAVEAARAGEQGRGFAVVASEVRNLAQRSAAAAKEIKTLIDDSVEKVGLGSQQVGEAGLALQEIVTGVNRITDVMSEITAASHEQQSGIEQVNQAIIQMDQVTQQNAALVEQAAAASAAMQDQARNLANVVSMFKLDASQTTISASSSHTTRAIHTTPVKASPRIASQRQAQPLKKIASTTKRASTTKPATTKENSDWEEF